MVLKFELPPLPYDFNALEPVISAEIMQIHYTKHHQTYVTNLNKALEQYAEAEQKNDLPAMIALQQTIKFNGGGHINHSLFWKFLCPPSKSEGVPPKGPLAEALEKNFGGHQNFVDQFSAKAIALQGSGWVWLGLNKGSKKLEIQPCDNQDPLSTKGLLPLLGVDVWEHAYYLQYKNLRADYVKAIWQIINWSFVAECYQKAIS